MKINLDVETYSEADLKKVGAWAYSLHPSTEVICMANANDDGEPVLWLPFEGTPNVVKHLSDENSTLHAWNSFFEYCIWVNVLKWPTPNITQWHDTAAQAAALALPRALGACGEALGLPQDSLKDKRGKYLIQRLCKPNRGKRIQDTDLLNEMYEYCKQDVIAERAIGNTLRPLSPSERNVWKLDQTINIKGVPIDRDSVDITIDLIDQEKTKLNEEVAHITEGALIAVSQRVKVMDYIQSLGYPLIKFDKAYLSEVLKDDDLHPKAKRLIEIRLQTGKTSLAKYDALKLITPELPRAHGMLRYHGASTGRWTGQLFQPQNLPRPTFNNTDLCIETLKEKDLEWLRVLYNDPLEAFSSCIRGMISAPMGKKLIVADYSAIEARVLAWLAGQEDVLEVFRGHGKLYEHTASQICRINIDNVTKDQRFIGKVATLALGYQGGSKAFMSMAEVYGVEIDAELAETVKTDWRKANQNVVKYWKGIENCAIEAVNNPGTPSSFRNIKFKCYGGFLNCRLPSGRLLAYYKPQMKPGMYGEQVTFMGTNSVTRKWERQNTYGGKLVENITQAVARDLMSEAMLSLDKAGYEIVLTVHDEIISEVAEDFGNVEEFERIMCTLPHWAKGLPIDAEGYESKRYRK